MHARRVIASSAAILRDTTDVDGGAVSLTDGTRTVIRGGYG